VCYYQIVLSKSYATRLSFDSPAKYRTRVQGQIKASWSDWLKSMAISLETSADEPTICTLEGDLPDQAALIGVFNTLYELHLPVLSVDCLTT
jgi:hypothetical protein